MKFFYDLHIHSCLSPCADDDMTPNNIVNMAKLCGLDIIAVSDHNSIQNVFATQKVGKDNGLLVVPAMELTTAEEIHCLILFESINDAMEFEAHVKNSQLKIKNKPDVFGKQLIVDANDNLISIEENLLIVASGISISKASDLASKYNGILIPAHIDRPSGGIIAILGGINTEMGFSSVELSPSCSSELRTRMNSDGYNILTNSDAHFLGAILEKGDNFIELNELSCKSLIEALKNKQEKKY